MKTVKYLIRFEAYEHEMSTEFEISKAEYERQLKFMQSQTETTIDDEDTPVESRELKSFRFPHSTQYVTTFQCGCAFTDLIKWETDEGFYFNPKSKHK